ncbi:MAG: hypothetical protein HOW73_14945 [Polyangiaceae bacterium]|nr:hypothetical protein [Polyangiaceae bacterium]
MRELSWLNAPLDLRLVDHRKQRFFEPRGLEGFFERGHSAAKTVIGPMRAEGVDDHVQVQAIAEWSPGSHWSSVESFANVERTTGNGAHVEGFIDALRAAIWSTVPECRGERAEHIREIATSGLRAVICVRLRDPEFAAPTRDKLKSPQARRAVSRVVRPVIQKFLQDHAELQAHFRNGAALHATPPEPR